MPFLLFKNIFHKKKCDLKEKLFAIKIIIIIIGLITNKIIDKSNIFNWIKEEFSKMKGIKLYSIFKIAEYVLLLINKFCSDIDLQIIKILLARKKKHQFFSFLILIIFIFFLLCIFKIFYFCTWLILNDINKNFFLIYLKVNFIEFKQSNKSFKSIHNFLSNDIFDRFLNYFILYFIILDGINKKKISIDLNNIYFERICLYLISEFLSDYLKGIITFKVNNLNPKDIKSFLKEEIDFYEQIDNDNSKDKSNKIYFYLKDTQLYEPYLSLIPKENIMCLLLNINIYPFIIMVLDICFIQNRFFSFNIIINIGLLIVLKLIIEQIIDLFNRKNRSDKRKIN